MKTPFQSLIGMLKTVAAARAQAFAKEFQSLIGMLKTDHIDYIVYERRRRFQSLIGMLKTVMVLNVTIPGILFQSLIGMLKTFCGGYYG